LTDPWHENVICPACGSGVRHRLPFAAFQNLDELSFDRLIRGKRVLHFAPERILGRHFANLAGTYVTADFFHTEYDLQLDMSNMFQVEDGSFDAVIAFDVLEHVPDYQKALEEVHRILCSGGFAIFTLPQKDHLAITFEDPTIVTEEGRLKHFGQVDHLRIFGDDFPATFERKGFSVSSIDESRFPEEMRSRYVLSPPVLSENPLATNFRKVFFGQKVS